MPKVHTSNGVDQRVERGRVISSLAHKVVVPSLQVRVRVLPNTMLKVRRSPSVIKGQEGWYLAVSWMANVPTTIGSFHF